MLNRERIQRQEVIEGWCTEQLREGRVGIVGDGPMAQHVAAYLAGMGVGNIYLVGNRRPGERTSQDFLNVTGDGQEEVHRIAEQVRRINPEVNVEPDCRPPLDAASEKNCLCLCDIVADMSDKADWKEITQSVASLSSRVGYYISASADATRAGCYIENVSEEGKRSRRRLSALTGGPQTGRDSRVLDILTGSSAHGHHRSRPGHRLVYEEGEQGSVPSAVIAAFCVDLMRYALMPLEQQGECVWQRDRDGRFFTESREVDGMSYEKPLLQERKALPRKSVHYSLYASDKTTTAEQSDRGSGSSAPSLEQTKALVIGAGGIGTYVGLHLALYGVSELHIADPDTVSVSNLNRQILFRESDAERSVNKAEALCASLSEINPRVNYRPVASPITYDSRSDVARENYDIVYSCVDDPRASKEISDLVVSLDRRVPLVYGNISAFRGNLGVYMPGQTPCAACQNEHYAHNIARLQEREQSNSCAQIAESNVVVPNALIGALMVGEGYLLLHSPEEAILNRKMRFNGHKTAYGLSMREVERCSCAGSNDPCGCQYLMERI